ncbi:MAG TPA: hypothetical protein VE251_00950 [Xanthobacteraceae bacterium]|nr:hypothetical protein [Xanthobacteraceae bacterium]
MANGRCTAWFELHRVEFGEVGKPQTQKQWFSPEYVQWMAQRVPGQCPVWMYEHVPEIPASRALPIDELVARYGNAFFTSSIAIMIACAIDEILEERDRWAAEGLPARQSAIGLYGIDMSASEEYEDQRTGCQHFLLLAADLGIQVIVPPESDLLRPKPIYAISESSHWKIKATAKRQELEQRLAQAIAQKEAAASSEAFLRGALDMLKYHELTWMEDRQLIGTHKELYTRMPAVREHVLSAANPEASETKPANTETIAALGETIAPKRSNGKLVRLENRGQYKGRTAGRSKEPPAARK